MGLTPMMRQYLETKEKYDDCVLFYRLGDFYEMFFEDALKISKVLGIALTGRECGLDERAPMCGIPYHALENYATKLIDKGYKLAICEQTSVADKSSKELVKREVVRIITPGTVVDTVMLDETENNYIASVALIDNVIGVSWADISTGEINSIQIDDDEKHAMLQDTLTRINPAEIIANSNMVKIANDIPCVKHKVLAEFTPYYDVAFEVATDNIGDKLKDLNMPNIDIKPLENSKIALMSFLGLLNYLSQTQKRTLDYFNKVNYEDKEQIMAIDMNSRRNLELTSTMQDRKKYGSLLWLLDKTKTCMGARTLREWIEIPSLNVGIINDRLDAVEELKNDLNLQNDLYEALSQIHDIERLIAKISYNNASPKDIETLGSSLMDFPNIYKVLNGCKSRFLADNIEKLLGLEKIAEYIQKAIIKKAPSTTKDGGFIQKGFDKTLDEYTVTKEEAGVWLAQMEQEEREKTGIKSLKIDHNKVFGYYIGITKSNIKDLPIEYERKQTLANCERYSTERLKRIEERILNATDNSLRLELKLFNLIREQIKKYTESLQNASKAIAKIDAVLSLASIAYKYNYSRPKIIEDSSCINIKSGRHPVVEAILKNDQFIANDTLVDKFDNRAMLITGPNMAGKSTYMRQVALITIMAHIGSFVPAQSAEIALTDKIFTRVGASDNLAFSQSTFMVEMSEVANILKNTSDNSLIILDEVGRGTSTYDGMSIASAVMEYLVKNTKAKILFATHYHEMTELESKLEGVKNYQVMIKELSDSIIFLRKIARGGCDRSFGIEVAKLAGLPKEVIDKAKVIIEQLSSSEHIPMTNKYENNPVNTTQHEVLGILNDLDLNNITPLLAFDTLQMLKSKLNK